MIKKGIKFKFVYGLVNSELYQRKMNVKRRPKFWENNEVFVGNYLKY